MYFKITAGPDYLAVEFHAPRSSNALSLEAARELAQLPKKFKAWRKPVVVTSAHPRLFCSGGNLSDYKKLKGKAPGLKINREITKHLDTFARWPVVKLAVIEGDVLGGGMEWLARFDFRWATPHVLMSFWQRRIGLSPGWGGGAAWSGKIGEENLRKLILEGRLLSATEAQDGNLIDRILPQWKLAEEIRHWAQQMSAAPTNDLLKWSTKTETNLFTKLWHNPEHKKVLKNWRG